MHIALTNVRKVTFKKIDMNNVNIINFKSWFIDNHVFSTINIVFHAARTYNLEFLKLNNYSSSVFNLLFQCF